MPRDESVTLTSAERVANNIVHTYGVEALALLIEGFRSGRTLEAMGREIGVTRERVRQWKLAMVRETVTVEVPSGVLALLERP